MRIATPSTSDTQISCARPLWCHLRPHHIGRPWLKATQLYMKWELVTLMPHNVVMFIYFSRHGPFTLIYFSSTNHPVGDVCCLEVSRQKGLLTSFSQPVFEPHASVTEKINQTEKKGGSSGMQKRRAGLLWKIGISHWLRSLRGACAASGVIFDHEGRLLFLSLSSAPLECQRFPFKNTDTPMTHVRQNATSDCWKGLNNLRSTCYINTWPPGPWTLGRAQRHHLALPSISIKPSWPSSGKLGRD